VTACPYCPGIPGRVCNVEVNQNGDVYHTLTDRKGGQIIRLVERIAQS
jgi:hypothetical protein